MKLYHKILTEQQRKHLKRFVFNLLGFKTDSKAIFEKFKPDTPWHQWVVDLALIKKHPYVLVGGVSNQIDFELEILKITQCKMLACDPTPLTIEYGRMLEKASRGAAIFFPVALGEEDGKEKFYVSKNSEGVVDYLYSERQHSNNEIINIPTRSVSSIMHEYDIPCLGLLKIDIEGNEHGVINSVLNQNLDIKQIAVEYHYRFSVRSFINTIYTHRKLLKSGYLLAYCTEWCEEFLYTKK